MTQAIECPPLGELAPHTSPHADDVFDQAVGQATGAASRHAAARLRGQAREHLAALLKYATNHVVAHVPVPALRHAWYRGVLGWRIEPGAAVGLDLRVITPGLRAGRQLVSLGAGAVIAEGCVLQSLGPIRIGARVKIGPAALLLTGAHDIEHPNFALVTAPVVIEDDACVGARAIVLGGVTVGRGAVVAPNAVVTKSVPPHAIVAGTPAQVVGSRTPGIEPPPAPVAS